MNYSFFMPVLMKHVSYIKMRVRFSEWFLFGLVHLVSLLRGLMLEEVFARLCQLMSVRRASK